MTPDKVIEWAREATEHANNVTGFPHRTDQAANEWTTAYNTRFAQLARADKQEECERALQPRACDPLDVMERDDPWLRDAKKALALPTTEPVEIGPVGLDVLLGMIRKLPTTRAPEFDGEESDGTPRRWRDRPFVSLTQLERTLRDFLKKPDTEPTSPTSAPAQSASVAGVGLKVYDPVVYRVCDEMRDEAKERRSSDPEAGIKPDEETASQLEWWANLLENTQSALMEDIYNQCCDILDPHVLAGTLPGSVVDSLQILIKERATHHQAQALPDERAEFEAWASKQSWFMPFMNKRRGNTDPERFDYYVDPDMVASWNAWQARAALAAKPAAELPDERAEFEHALMDRYGWERKDFKRDHHDGYLDGQTDTAWMAWQLRAALAAKPVRFGAQRVDSSPNEGWWITKNGAMVMHLGERFTEEQAIQIAEALNDVSR